MDNPDFKLTKISTIMLGVRGLAPAVAFYSDKLGLAIQFQIPGFAFLNAGGVTLCLSEPLAKALAKPTDPLAGVTEIVFAVDEVEGAYDILSARGIKFSNKPHAVTESQWAANFEDPDGHKLSVFGSRNKTEDKNLIAR